MLRLAFIVCLLSLTFSSTNTLRASHILGGTLGYRFEGETSDGKLEYSIVLITYTDCAPSSEIPFPENPLWVGVYARNQYSPLGERAFLDSIRVDLLDSVKYTPSTPPGCSIADQSCIYEGRYEGRILLDPNLEDVWFYYERCCRNVGVVNIHPNQSQGFIAYMRNTSYKNSSPSFLFPPLPFVCINDSTPGFHQSSDSDGDFLSYSISKPISGFGSQVNTTPNLPNPYLPLLIPETLYGQGFSYQQPFGNSGNYQIGLTTGIAQYYMQVPGPYVFALEVREYNNIGELVGITQRDLQNFGLPCPLNDAPFLQNSIPNPILLSQGDTTCFILEFADKENDSILFDDLFSAGFENDLGIGTPFLDTVFTKDTTLQVRICFERDCSLLMDSGQVFLSIKDEGCPPKDAVFQFNVLVDSLELPIISGPDTLCKGNGEVSYNLSPEMDSLLKVRWEVEGNTFDTSMGGYAIVDWGQGDSGWVAAHFTSLNGCGLGSDTLFVRIIDIPELTIHATDTPCAGDTIPIFIGGDITSPFNTYGVGRLFPDSNNWYGTFAQSGYQYLSRLEKGLCPPSDSVWVEVLKLPLGTFVDSTRGCLGDTVAFTLLTEANFVWLAPYPMYQDSTNYLFSTTLDSTLHLEVLLTDSNGCRQNVVQSFSPADPVEFTGFDSTEVCLNEEVTLGGITNANTITWTPPDYLSDPNSAQPIYGGQESMSYTVEATDSLGCISEIEVYVEVKELPVMLDLLVIDSVSCFGFEQYLFLEGGGDSLEVYLEEQDSAFYSGYGGLVLLPKFEEFGKIQVVGHAASLCRDTLLVEVPVKSYDEAIGLHIPNVFTPNQDGINDVFQIGLDEIVKPCSELRVFNRWGNLIHFDHSGACNWAGDTSQGKKAPAGTYFFELRYGTQVKTGTILLVR